MGATSHGPQKGGGMGAIIGYGSGPSYPIFKRELGGVGGCRPTIQAIYMYKVRHGTGHTTPFMVFSVMYTICEGLKPNA